MLDVRISNKVIIEVISSFTPSVPKEEIEKYEKEYDNYKNNKSHKEIPLLVLKEIENKNYIHGKNRLQKSIT